MCTLLSNVGNMVGTKIGPHPKSALTAAFWSKIRLFTFSQKGRLLPYAWWPFLLDVDNKVWRYQMPCIREHDKKPLLCICLSDTARLCSWQADQITQHFFLDPLEPSYRNGSRIYWWYRHNNFRYSLQVGTSNIVGSIASLTEGGNWVYLSFWRNFHFDLTTQFSSNVGLSSNIISKPFRTSSFEHLPGYCFFGKHFFFTKNIQKCFETYDIVI